MTRVRVSPDVPVGGGPRRRRPRFGTRVRVRVPVSVGAHAWVFARGLSGFELVDSSHLGVVHGAGFDDARVESVGEEERDEGDYQEDEHRRARPEVDVEAGQRDGVSDGGGEQ